MHRLSSVMILTAAVIGGSAVLSFGDGPSELPLAVRTYKSQAESDVPPFPVVERAAQTHRELSGWPAMVNFLTTHVQRFPDDDNNGYYLTIVGDLYNNHGSPAVARQYHRRALLSYPDVSVRSVSTHRVVLDRLLDIVDDPAERLEYLTYLEDRYPDNTDPGVLAYYLGKAYEGVGRWDDAYTSYRQFLRHPAARVPGEPRAHELIERRVAFYESSQSWTQRDLNDLVAGIKNALWRQDPRALLSHRAGVNFFAMSWEQEESDANSDIPTFDIAAFLRRSRVRFEADLEISSNASEAYLRTWGWSHRIPTWYLYFRKVDYPADPEIHGTWEWAGIYFGEAI
ncbi:MAG: tetratricopeptide repeat protein [Alkalispirochaeta sp.]